MWFVQALAGVGGESQEEISSQVGIAESETHEELAQSDLVGKSNARSGPDMESGLALRDDVSVLQISDDCWISPPDSGHSVTYADSPVTNSSPENFQGLKMLENGDSNMDVHHTPGTGDVSNLSVNPDISDASLDLSSPPVSSATSTPLKSQQSGLNSSSEKEPSVFTSDSKLEHHNGPDTSSGDLHGLAHSKEIRTTGADTAPRTPLFKGITTSLYAQCTDGVVQFHLVAMDSNPLLHYSWLYDLKQRFVHSEIWNAGKNAYAISVLKRVQMKLEGQEVDGSRYPLSRILVFVCNDYQYTVCHDFNEVCAFCFTPSCSELLWQETWGGRASGQSAAPSYRD